MNITITITDASPEDLTAIAAFVEQMQSRGVAVEAPQEQAQEPQEDHLQKVKDSNITCEYDAQAWATYAKQRLDGQDLQDALAVIQEKLESATLRPQIEAQPEQEPEKGDLGPLRRKYRSVSKKYGIHPRVHELLKIKGGSSAGWSRKVLEALCAVIPMGPTEHDYCQMRDFTREMELKDFKRLTVVRIIEERIRDGQMQTRPWLLHLLCNWNDHYPMHQTILKFAGSSALYAMQLSDAFRFQVPDLRRNKPTLDQWLKDFDEKKVDSEEIETFYNRCHQLLQNGVDFATLYKNLGRKVRAGSYNPATVVKFLWSIRSLEDGTRNEKSQPHGEAGPFVK